MTTAYKFLRAIGMFLGNLLAAALASGLFISELYGIFPTHTPWAGLVKETVLSLIVAFGLGYLVYYKWRPGSSKWVFLAGLCWLWLGALLFWSGQRNLRFVNADHSIYWDLSGVGCKNFDRQSCVDYIQYTLLTLRTVFYSVGAFCCSRVGPVSFAGVEDALFGPRRDQNTTADNTDLEDQSYPHTGSRKP